MLCRLAATIVWRIKQRPLCRYGGLVLAGEALGACSVVLYGLCIIRRALPAPAPGMQAAADDTNQAFHVQARTRQHRAFILNDEPNVFPADGAPAVGHLMTWSAATS